MKSINDTTFNIQDESAIVLMKNGLYQRYHGSVDTTALVNYVSLKTSTNILQNFANHMELMMFYVTICANTKDALIIFI